MIRSLRSCSAAGRRPRPVLVFLPSAAFFAADFGALGFSDMDKLFVLCSTKYDVIVAAVNTLIWPASLLSLAPPTVRSLPCVTLVRLIIPRASGRTGALLLPCGRTSLSSPHGWWCHCCCWWRRS